MIDIDKNYKLADAEINRRIEIIEGGYALNSDVNTEIERAKNEEKRLETLVGNKVETSIFNGKIQEIENNITNITNNEISHIKENYALNSTLNSEIARAEGVENELLVKINAESERAVSKENTIETLVVNETSRAKAKENELNESIVEIKALVGDKGKGTGFVFSALRKQKRNEGHR